MKITLTPQDIAQGQRKEPLSCPIALAINRCAKVTTARVGYAFVKVKPSEPPYDLPLSARAFAEAFDKGLPVGPISFELK